MKRQAEASAIKPTAVSKRRCAVYTRKSTDEGLEKTFNTLDAQGAACAAYIESQRAEGWIQVAARYDDGGFSGATTDRPALQRLRADIPAGRASAIRSAASSPTSSQAVRYWNRARQRYRRLSAT